MTFHILSQYCSTANNGAVNTQSQTCSIPNVVTVRGHCHTTVLHPVWWQWAPTVTLALVPGVPTRLAVSSAELLPCCRLVHTYLGQVQRVMWRRVTCSLISSEVTASRTPRLAGHRPNAPVHHALGYLAHTWEYNTCVYHTWTPHPQLCSTHTYIGIYHTWIPHLYTTPWVI